MKGIPFASRIGVHLVSEKELAVFDAWCPTCDARILYGPRSILSLRHEADGIVVTFRCHCGTVGTTTFGSRRTASEGAEAAG